MGCWRTTLYLGLLFSTYAKVRGEVPLAARLYRIVEYLVAVSGTFYGRVEV